MTDQTLIDIGTRIQRRRDFGAHLTGFTAGAAVLLVLHMAGAYTTTQVVVTLLVWGTALSFQHFRHVLRGPVTTADLAAEQKRRN